MSEYDDLRDMIDVLDIAIAREEIEEKFFRRSAIASSRETAKKMLAEIADEFKNFGNNLQARKRLLEDTLNNLART